MMIINMVTGFIIVTGLLLIIIEQVFSYSLFNHTSTVGFIMIAASVLLLSFKVSRESKKVEAKYYDNFPASGGPGSSVDKRYHANTTDSVDVGGDFSGGGGGDGS